MHNRPPSFQPRSRIVIQSQTRPQERSTHTNPKRERGEVDDLTKRNIVLKSTTAILVFYLLCDEPSRKILGMVRC